MRNLRGPVPSRRAVMILVWVVAFLVLAVIAYLFFAVLRQGVEADQQKMSVAQLKANVAQARREREELRVENARQDRQLNLANLRLIAAGKQPVVVPPPVAPSVVFGPEGPRGARGAGGLAGRAGLTGKTGATGARGALGPVGATGSGGPAGAAGPAGVDGKDGAAGKDGSNGTDGQAGVGIVSIDCTSGPSSLSFTIHFTSGPDQVVTCNTVVPLP